MMGIMQISLLNRGTSLEGNIWEDIERGKGLEVVCAKHQYGSMPGRLEKHVAKTEEIGR